MKAIEITTGMNGYPSHLHRGYIDFDSFEEAEAFAKKYNGQVVELVKRDGWQLWQSRGYVLEELKVSAETFGDDYSTVESTDAWNDDCREVLSALIADGADIDELAEAAAEMKTVLDKVEDLDENEAVLLCHGRFHSVIKTKTMAYYNDTWYHIVGVEINGYNDDADNECD